MNPIDPRSSLRRTYARRAATRDVVLLIVAVVLLGAAGWYFIRGGRPDIPTGPESEVEFICQSCGKTFRLNGLEIHQADRKIAYRSPRDGGSAGGFPCKHCGEWAGVRPPEEP